MAVFASLFFASAAIAGLWVIVAMLSDNRARILAALRMEPVAAFSPPPVPRTVRRAIRTRSAVAPAQWRAAA